MGKLVWFDDGSFLADEDCWVFMLETSTVPSPPREGEPAGTGRHEVQGWGRLGGAVVGENTQKGRGETPLNGTAMGHCVECV